jgi:hypothetical protein
MKVIQLIKANLSLTGFWQESNNFRGQTAISMLFPMAKFLDFKVNYLYTFESIVVERQKQDDKILTFGVNLKI